MAIKLHNREPLAVGSVVKLIHFEDLKECYRYPLSEAGYRKTALTKNSEVLFGNERVEDKSLVVYTPVDMVEHMVYGSLGGYVSVRGDDGHTALMFDSMSALYDCPLIVTRVLENIGAVNRYRIATFTMNSYRDSEMDFGREFPRFAYRPTWEPETEFPFVLTDDFLIRTGYRLD